MCWGAGAAAMGKREFIDDQGLRRDGRRSNEVRRIKCQLGVLQDADGSAMFEIGNTQVGAWVGADWLHNHFTSSYSSTTVLLAQQSAHAEATMHVAKQHKRPRGRAYAWSGPPPAGHVMSFDAKHIGLCSSSKGSLPFRTWGFQAARRAVWPPKPGVLKLVC